MNEFLYRPRQELDKIGDIYSSKDEKQRVIAEEIRNLRIKPKQEILLNMNIQGLDKRKVFGGRNPATLRFYAPFITTGRTGVKYIGHYHNIARFVVPGFVVLFYYYTAENYMRAAWYDKEMNNCETETTYVKMQTFSCHFPEKHTLMA